MPAPTQVSYIGKGTISVGGNPIGNCSKVTMSIEEETKELMDYENPGGGVLDSVSRIKSVKMTMECSNFSAANLALATRGTAASGTVQALTESSAEYAISFDGLNEARSGAACSVEVFRAKFAPMKSIDLISDDFGRLTLEATVLKDASKTGVGVSKYFTISIGNEVTP